MCLYQISSSPWPNMACHRPPRSLSNNQNFKSWMPRIYRYIYFFLTIKSLIQTYFLLCTFWNFVPLPHPFQLIACPAEFCLCYLLWMCSFLIIPMLISVVCHLKSYLLIGQAWVPSLLALVVSLWLCWYLFPLSPCHPFLHQYENKHRKTKTLESRVWSFLFTALLDLLHYIKL